jgi:hypothetical protein
LISEVALIRQQIADEYLAATRGLAGLAYGASQHKFISQRMENMEYGRERLIELVGEEQASAIFIETLAGIPEQNEMEKKEIVAV